MIQGKLNTLVGRSSGYIESLPTPVRRRIDGLKGIQKDHTKLEADFHEEVLGLEKKYFALFTPLYEKRSKIVNGQAEPTEAEIEAGAAGDEEEEEEEEAKEAKSEKPGDAHIKGIPEFWLTAMKNSQALAATITDRDEAALKYITDIRIAYPDKHGFQLIFEFASNEFFTNKQITKTYFYQDSGYPGDYIYDHATGDKIDWKDGKDLTVRIESKKQRNKSMSSTSLDYLAGFEAKFFFLQTPSKLVLSRGRFHARASSTSSPHQTPQLVMRRTLMMRPRRSASV